MAVQSNVTQQNLWAGFKDQAQNCGIDIVISGIPTDGVSGTGVGIAGPGALCRDYATGTIYYNSNILASPVWTPVIRRAIGTISSAVITGTAAGQLGHANGVVLIAAPAAGFALQLVAYNLFYTFGVAAYTGGGNLTVNWGAGGAAITGLLSAANSLTAASSKAGFFIPLSAAALVVVSAAGLNLVSSAAPTQPGTAAGTIAWECYYRVVNVGF